MFGVCLFTEIDLIMAEEHWQNIYTTKTDDQVSWTQEYPSSVVSYINEISLAKDAKIIDIGGGASRLVDTLLELGYTNITVLDISQAALDRSQERLGSDSAKVTWIVTDILDFKPKKEYDFWYDRAVFHFFTDENDKSAYVNLTSKYCTIDGHLLLGTFSENGPLKCSGLEVSRYSADQMIAQFNPYYQVNRCFKEQHKTPFDTIQEFQFCGFTKK